MINNKIYFNIINIKIISKIFNKLTSLFVEYFNTTVIQICFKNNINL